MRTVKEMAEMFRGMHRVMEKDLPEVFPKDYREGFLAAAKELDKESRSDG